MSDFYPKQRPWYFWPLFPFIKIFAFIFCQLLGPFRWRKEQKWPKGGLLILSNHLSDTDPVFLYLACGSPMYFMGKKELFSMSVIGPLIKFFGAFPVERGSPDRTAIRYSIDRLKAGHRVGIFPEGQLSETGLLQPVLPGAAMIAKMAGVPIVCCGLINTDRVMPYGKLIPRPSWKWVRANFGEVRKFSDEANHEEIVTWVSSELARLTTE